jgi:hypothetical protein
MSIGSSGNGRVSKTKNIKTPAEQSNPFVDVGFVIFAVLGLTLPVITVIWAYYTCGI